MGEGMERLSETLPSASFSLYRGRPVNDKACNKNTGWFQHKENDATQHERNDNCKSRNIHKKRKNKAGWNQLKKTEPNTDGGYKKSSSHK